MVARLQYLRFCLFEICVSVVFVIRSLYSTVSLTLVKVKKRFIRIIIVTECICTLCLCCCTLCVALSVLFRVCTSFDLLRMCYV